MCSSHRSACLRKTAATCFITAERSIKTEMNQSRRSETPNRFTVVLMTVEMEVKNQYALVYSVQSHRLPTNSHLSFSQVVVNHCEIEAELFHIILVALQEEQVTVHLWIQGGQVVDVHICAGSKKLGQEKTGKGQLYQHVLIQRLWKM